MLFFGSSTFAPRLLGFDNPVSNESNAFFLLKIPLNEGYFPNNLNPLGLELLSGKSRISAEADLFTLNDPNVMVD